MAKITSLGNIARNIANVANQAKALQKGKKQSFGEENNRNNLVQSGANFNPWSPASRLAESTEPSETPGDVATPDIKVPEREKAPAEKESLFTSALENAPGPWTEPEAGFPEVQNPVTALSEWTPTGYVNRYGDVSAAMQNDRARIEEMEANGDAEGAREALDQYNEKYNSKNMARLQNGVPNLTGDDGGLSPFENAMASQALTWNSTGNPNSINMFLRNADFENQIEEQRNRGNLPDNAVTNVFDDTGFDYGEDNPALNSLTLYDLDASGDLSGDEVQAALDDESFQYMINGTTPEMGDNAARATALYFMTHPELMETYGIEDSGNDIDFNKFRNEADDDVWAAMMLDPMMSPYYDEYAGMEQFQDENGNFDPYALLAYARGLNMADVGEMSDLDRTIVFGRGGALSNAVNMDLASRGYQPWLSTDENRYFDEYGNNSDLGDWAVAMGAFGGLNQNGDYLRTRGLSEDQVTRLLNTALYQSNIDAGIGPEDWMLPGNAVVNYPGASALGDLAEGYNPYYIDPSLLRVGTSVGDTMGRMGLSADNPYNIFPGGAPDEYYDYFGIKRGEA